MLGSVSKHHLKQTSPALCCFQVTLLISKSERTCIHLIDLMRQWRVFTAENLAKCPSWANGTSVSVGIIHF